MTLLRAHATACMFMLPLLALTVPLEAQPVYVSTGAGQQILAFDSNSGAVTGVCNISPATPEDVIVGPDGQLYVADTTGNRIFRVPTPIPAPASPAASCSAVAVYDQATAACTDAGGSPATCPTGPEGPSFVRIATLDLYFNTHGAGSTGVWKMPAIANAANGSCNTNAGPPCPGPMQVFASNTSGEGSGEGLDFDDFGKLLAVDQTNNRVFRGTVACLQNPTAPGCPTVFINANLSSPVGIAINTCGNVLVASGKFVNRYDSSSAAFLDSFSFGGNNLARFLEVDSSNHIFAITASDENGKNGTFWRLDPPNNNSLTSCGLKSFTTGLNIAIKTSLAPGIATGNGLGLGISATNTSIPGSFTAVNPSNTYNFGAQHSFTITCNGVIQPFNITVTAVKSQPTDAPNPDVTFSPPQFTQTTPATPTGIPQCPVSVVQAECLHYGGQHGFCTQYLEAATDGNGNPISDANLSGFCSASPSPFTFFVTYSAPESINDPGGAHVSTDGAPNPVTEAFTDCQSQDFYPQSTTGDPLRLSGGNSKHVIYNAALAFSPPGTITLNSPISSCSVNNGITTCNPQFNIGQNINTKFALLQGTSPLTTATEQLSIARTSHTVKGGKLVSEFVPQTVVATKNSATLNFFVPNSAGQYSYNVDSSAFDPLPKGSTATFQFTIWGNGAQPFTFFTTGTF